MFLALDVTRSNLAPCSGGIGNGRERASASAGGGGHGGAVLRRELRCFLYGEC